MDFDRHPGDMYLTLSHPARLGDIIKEYARSQGTVDIGRGPRGDTGVSDPHSGKFRSSKTKVMSASHARITWEAGHAFLADAQSTNGTSISRDGAEFRLKPRVAYRIKAGDTITFGRQVDNHNAVTCKPVVLVVGFSAQSAFPPSSRVGAFAMSIQRGPLPRSHNTLKALVDAGDSASEDEGESQHDQDKESEDEQDEVDGALPATQIMHASSRAPNAYSNRKRGGFGLSEEDVLDAAEVSASMPPMTSRPLARPIPPFSFPKVESAATIKVSSHVLTHSSWAPPNATAPTARAYTKTQWTAQAEPAARPFSSKPVHPRTVLRLPSPVSPEERRDPPSSLSKGPRADRDGDVIELLPGKRYSSPSVAFASSISAPSAAGVFATKPKEDRKMPIPPTSLFSRPFPATAPHLPNIRISKPDEHVLEEPLSDVDAESQVSHLPSPVLSIKDADEAEQFEGFRLDSSLGPHDAAAVQRVADTEDRRDQRRKARFASVGFMAYSDSSEAEVVDFAEYVHESEVSRPATPVGRDFSPPTTSPLSTMLDSFLAEQEEVNRLVRDAETEAQVHEDESSVTKEAGVEPPSSLDVSEAEEEEQEEQDEELESLVDERDLAAVEFPDGSAAVEATPALADLAQPAPDVVEAQGTMNSHQADVAPEIAVEGKFKLQEAEDVDDPIEEVESDVEPAVRAVGAVVEEDPDVDEFDLDIDMCIDGEEVDERDGLGMEEEKWEDGVSEKLEVEKDEVEKVEAEDDSGYSSADALTSPPAFIVPYISFNEFFANMAQPAKIMADVAPVPTTAINRKRRLSETDLEQEVEEQVAPAKVDSSSSSSDKAVVTVTSSAVRVVVTPSSSALVEREPKRRRILSTVGTHALSFAAGMIAAMGGLSALGALLEEE